jgi:hypothetical protein
MRTRGKVPLKCTCGHCQTCWSRVYRRKRADAARAGIPWVITQHHRRRGKPEPEPKKVSLAHYRLEEFFARRRQIWESVLKTEQN